jgi:hypothetical protein
LTQQPIVKTIRNILNGVTNALFTKLIYASKEYDLKVKVEKIKYMFMSCLQTTGQNYYIKVTNKSFENLAVFIYLGMIVINQNCIHEEMKSSLFNLQAVLATMQFRILCLSPRPVWWPRLKNSPTVTHACRKRRLKWVLIAWGYSWATLSLGVINTEAWSSRLGGWALD